MDSFGSKIIAELSVMMLLVSSKVSEMLNTCNRVFCD